MPVGLSASSVICCAGKCTLFKVASDSHEVTVRRVLLGEEMSSKPFEKMIQDRLVQDNGAENKEYTFSSTAGRPRDDVTT